MDSKIIHALKNNKYPFGLMTEEMQAKAREIGIRLISLYTRNVDGKYEFLHWSARQQSSFYENKVYQLPDHYAERSEIKKCTIRPDGICLVYDRVRKAIDIAFAASDPDFFGFEYEDGSVHPFARKYQYKDKTRGHLATLCTLESGETEVLIPTHVLFRKA